MSWPRPPRPATELPLILVVDDEPTVLETLCHQLGTDFQVATAIGGPQALAILEQTGPYAAVISDMRMPDMDGLQLFAEVAAGYPDIVRVLHTAAADVETALAAINTGGIFRFLRKPCPTAELRRTARDAVERHRMTLAEHDVLDQTLRGSIQALFGCLELASPRAFARAGRIRNLVMAVCDDLRLGSVWEIEVAVMASQLGAVTLPPAVLDKLDRGLPLTADEQNMVDAVPGISVRLLQAVPRLDDVLDIIRGLDPEAGNGELDRQPDPGVPARRIVATAIDVIGGSIEFESLEARGVDADSAITVLERDGGPSAEVIAALRRVRAAPAAGDLVRALRLSELTVGMTIAADVRALNGLVLIGRGTVVTGVMVDRLNNFRRTAQLVEPIYAVVPSPPDTER